MSDFVNLFGDDFSISLEPKNSIKKLIDKITSSDSDALVIDEEAVAKALKSNKISIQDQLTIITDRVLKTLGRQKNNVKVIYSKDELDSYIDKAISCGEIAVDTETNNSLDPVTCKLMGLCLYIPNDKQVYVPINHKNLETKERLENQLTEEDCRECLQRLKDTKTFIIMHNGKFDYEVIKETCNIELPPDWDTMIAARLLDENELAGLKYQYVTKIDSSQEKYDIEKLFLKVPYAYVDPEIFALYAATDSLMTYKLYLYQKPNFEKEENKKLYWLFKNIEVPIAKVTAEMELRGVKIDQNFGERLRLKYNNLLDEIDKKIEAELESLKPQISTWRLDPENSKSAKVYMPKKSKKSAERLEEEFPYTDSTGKRYKFGNKSKAAQLDDPINLASPAQLAILFYDVLKVPTVSKKAPRGTGEEELKAIAEKTDNPLCKLILERRGIVKLITTYIDVIPELAKHWPDGRIRFHLNSLGTDTGRYSSGGTIKFLDEATDNQIEVSGINIQNIPSRGDGSALRMLFVADNKEEELELQDNIVYVNEISEVETSEGWKFPVDLTLDDEVLVDNLAKKLELKAYNSITRQFMLKFAQ